MIDKTPESKLYAWLNQKELDQQVILPLCSYETLPESSVHLWGHQHRKKDLDVLELDQGRPGRRSEG